MRNKLSSLLVLALILVSSSMMAQSQAEINMAKQMAKQYGYSESEIETMMGGKSGSKTNTQSINMTESGQIVRMTQEDSLKLIRNKKNEKLVDEFSNLSVYEQLVLLRKQVKEDSLKVYGYDIFTSEKMNFQPSYNIPTPKNYKLSAGDEVIINIWGATYLNYNLTISPEGSITIPELGPVQLLGKTVEQATESLKGHLSRIYSGISSEQPSTFVDLSVGKIRSVAVSVVGAVNEPGSFTLPSLSTLFSALYLAGGPAKEGSFRYINIYRNNKFYKSVDIYKFIIDGDLSDNVRLEDGDMIVVEPYKSRVRAEGAFKRPMLYDMKEGETLDKFVKYAAFFAAGADMNMLNVVRISADEPKSFNVEAKDFATFILRDGDVVTAYKSFAKNQAVVNISGAVVNPGNYAIDDNNKSVGSLLKLAGGVTNEAYLKRGYVKRYDEGYLLSAANFNVEEVLAGRSDLILQPEDSVFIYKNSALIDTLRFVTVYGAVNKPGEVEFRKGMTVSDAILLSGGYKSGAVTHNVQVARRNSDSSPTKSDTIALIYDLNFKDYPEDENFELELFDVVTVKRFPSYREQKIISIEGEVAYPGSYVVARNDVRLTDILKSAGGITDNAYMKGATLKRKYTKEQIEQRIQAAKQNAKMMGDKDKLSDGQKALLASSKSIGASMEFDPNTGTTKDNSNKVEGIDEYYQVAIDLTKALEYPDSYHDIILQNGDIINVPQYNYTVRVSGGVLRDNVLSYNEAMSYRNYIKSSGGFVKGAMRNKVYVVYPNGDVSTKMSKGGLKVTPGSEIVVPYQDPSEKKRMSPGEIVSIASASASLATVIITLVNLIGR